MKARNSCLSIFCSPSQIDTDIMISIASTCGWSKNIKHLILSQLRELVFPILVFKQKTHLSKEEHPGSTRNFLVKPATFWFTQEDRYFPKPVTKTITRKVKNIKTRNRNQETHSWSVPGSSQEVSVLVYL
jgi:hypothetical protein